MLKLKKITKTYRTNDVETKALDGVSVSFRDREFVAILGTSGSGKTTCLNIIGGLDRYDSGDLIIKGRSTKDFKDSDWDAYRNNTIGFIFQSYNLIGHLSLIENVEMGMTLSGVSREEKRRRALEALEKVGLKEHVNKRPNQLSGGQMQRVAIARALANDPEILLCDEPTGALDTTTSIQIMDLIKEVAKDKLVIMVTHNPDLAEEYADRIINFKDGNIINDSNPFESDEDREDFELKKTSMSFFTALHISFNNIKSKKGRTFLTAFASSIGIIGIAVILSLSNGFQQQIDRFQGDAMSEFPITISQSAMDVSAESMGQMHSSYDEKFGNIEEYGDYDEAFLYDPSEFRMVHKNNFTEEYLQYIENIDETKCESIGYTRIVGINAVRSEDGNIIPVHMPTGLSAMSSMGGKISSMGGAGLSSYPTSKDKEEPSYLEMNYDIIAGSYPKDEKGIVIVVDSKNRIDVRTLKNLGIDTKNLKSIKFSDLVGMEIKIVNNDDYYKKTPNGNFMMNTNYQEMYNSDKSFVVRIDGIVRQREDIEVAVLGNGIAYSDDLSQRIIEDAESSEIVNEQKKVDYNVLTMEKLGEDDKTQMLSYLGGNSIPFMINIYPRDFESKEYIIDYLDKYNDSKTDVSEKVVYNDLAATITSMTSGIMNGITLVLVAFAATSLIVSLIMICIITYTSVLERTREIGILKALGARKKDITRVFDAETFILGIFSGTLGVIIAWILTFPINAVILKKTELEGVASLKPSHAVILIVVSTILTIIGGHVPAKMASNKDAVEALRSE